MEKISPRKKMAMGLKARFGKNSKVPVKKIKKATRSR